MNMISVIVPVYKVEQYIDRCLQSIIHQTYRNLEIILVDDGSPDSCPTLCDEWKNKDNRICVIHKTNGGLSDARNAGLAVAKGDLIAFVDSDDWIAPETYERLKSALDMDHSDIAACSVEMVYEDGRKSELLTVKENGLLNRAEAQKALLDESKLKHPVWYKLYRRPILEGILFEKGKQHEDVYWSYQVIGNASKVSLIDYIGYYYWQRTDSIMGEKYSLKRLDVIEAYCRRYKYTYEHFPELEVAARRSIFSSCIYHGQMAMKYLPAHEQEEALSYLESVKARYPLSNKDLKGLKITHKLWLSLGRVSLRLVCRIKNNLKVGF